MEHLAVCARFVDRNREVREKFLSFIRIQRITGKQIAETLITFLQDNNIPLADMRGQGYDGASNMSSSHSGVQARIREVAPLATYVHCGGHCLNLVIVKSCSLPDVQHVLDQLENCCRIFLNSPKQRCLLQLVMSNNVFRHPEKEATAGSMQDSLGYKAVSIPALLPVLSIYCRCTGGNWLSISSRQVR